MQIERKIIIKESPTIITKEAQALEVPALIVIAKEAQVLITKETQVLHRQLDLARMHQLRILVLSPQVENLIWPHLYRMLFVQKKQEINK